MDTKLARLVAITLPCEELGVIGAEEFIAYAARVSNPANQNNQATADKLIRYLIRNKHWSPFEMVHMVVEINTTRDIGRQILRHRSFSFQEFSQRYAEASTEFHFREARLQDKKNRQNSIRTSDEKLARNWLRAQRAVGWLSNRVYEWGLKAGIAKEQARAVLPEGMTPTRMYMSGTLRSFIHYCELRCGNGTQLEHKEVADAIMDIIRDEFPNVANAIDTSVVNEGQPIVLKSATNLYPPSVNNGLITAEEVRKILDGGSYAVSNRI